MLSFLHSPTLTSVHNHWKNHNLDYRWTFVGKVMSLLFNTLSRYQFSSVAQSCPLFPTPWTAARQASLSITNSQSLLKLMSIESVMPSNHLILCHPFLFLPSILPCIRVFSSELTLHMRWPKYWSFSFSISPSKGLSGVFSSRSEEHTSELQSR